MGLYFSEKYEFNQRLCFHANEMLINLPITIIQLTNRFYFQKCSMNDHSMFVRRSTDVNSSIAVFSVVNIKTAIYHCTASLGEW